MVCIPGLVHSPLPHCTNVSTRGLINVSQVIVDSHLEIQAFPPSSVSTLCPALGSPANGHNIGGSLTNVGYFANVFSLTLLHQQAVRGSLRQRQRCLKAQKPDKGAQQGAGPALGLPARVLHRKQRDADALICC